MRTPRTRARAESALHSLLSHLGAHVKDVTVVGGLNPPLLAPCDDAPHQGTVDVDLAIDLEPVYDRDEQDYGWLEHALLAAGFTPSGEDRAWRWSSRRDGIDVHLDILCDVQDSPGQQLALPGARLVTAMNLAGPAAALADVTQRPVSVVLTDGSGGTDIQVRYAGLGGYLLAKAAALASRHAPKDTYDLAFVILHNPGGPGAAGAAARRALPVHRETYFAASFRSCLNGLLDIESAHLQAYSEQRVRDGLDDDPLTIRLDVAAAARACLATFDEDGAPR